MKIGIDARGLEGKRTGVGRYLSCLLEQWSGFKLPQGLRFILYFKSDLPSDLNYLTGSFFQLRSLGLQSNTFFRQYALPREANKDKIDLLFCPEYLGPLSYQGRIVLAQHDIVYQARPDLYDWPGLLDKLFLRYLSRKSAQKAEKILACSEFTREEIIKHYQVNPQKVYRIYLAASQKFRPNGHGLNQERWGIKNKYILYVSSIIKRRHLDKVILAFGQISQQLPEHQFLIVGDDRTKQNIAGLINRINQQAGRLAIIQKDWLSEDELVQVYQSADLFVWLSDYEGFGLPPLEAMSCGVPVITSQTSSLPEVAGSAAFYVKNNSDINEISQAIRLVLSDRRLREKMINQGLVQAQRFSWSKTAQETLNVLLK